MNLFKYVLILAFASFAAVTKMTMPTDYSSVSAGTRANLKANFDETQTKFNPAADSIDEVRGRMSGYTGEFTISSLDNLRLRIDTDGSSVARFYVANGYTSDSLFRVAEDSTWKFWGPGIATKLTLSDSILAATARISGLTASRLMATNAGSTLASVSDLTAWIAGTSNQITSTSDGDGSITLSIPNGFTLPSASPTFTNLTLSGTLGVTGAVTLGNYSSGRVPMFSTAGLVTQDDLYWDATNDRLGIGSAAATPAYTLDVLKSTTGSAVVARIGNSESTNPASSARLEISTAGASAGDPFILFNNNVVNWSIGSDNSDADALVITPSATPGGATNAVRITTTGAVTVPGTLGVTGKVTGSDTVAASLGFRAGNAGATDVSLYRGSGDMWTTPDSLTVGGVIRGSDTVVAARGLRAGGGEAFVYGDTSFTLTATGMTTSPTGTAYATKIGNMVNILVPFITGTSNASTFTLTGIPAGWRPARTVAFQYHLCQDNGSAALNCNGRILSTGVIDLGNSTFPASIGGWTSSGTKAAGESGGTYTITYNLQ